MGQDPRGGTSGEGELIRRAQQGDGEAFEALVRSHQNRIFWVAYQLVNNAEEARDVTQNVLVRLWRVLDRYDPRYAFSTWVYRMTVNLAIDALRRESPRQRDCSLDSQLVAWEPQAPGSTGPLEQAKAREVERIFRELKDLLPVQQRAVFVLREMEGLSSDEVAEVMGLSASTVRNHLFQARKTLRQELERRYPEYLPASTDRSRGEP